MEDFEHVDFRIAYNVELERFSAVTLNSNHNKQHSKRSNNISMYDEMTSDWLFV